MSASHVIAIYATVTAVMMCVAMYLAVELCRRRAIQRVKDRRVLKAMNSLEEKAKVIGWSRAVQLAQECRAIINDGQEEIAK